jgi:hypothetical protein
MDIEITFMNKQQEEEQTKGPSEEEELKVQMEFVKPSQSEVC